MSELIDNRRQRRETLKQIIRDIHQNVNPHELKERFRELLSDVGATEIAALEQELIQEGLPETEIKSLCDVHVSVFKESLDNQPKSQEQGGHPIHTFRKENKAIERVVQAIRPLLEQIQIVNPDANFEDGLKEWQSLHQQLLEIEKHYSRKENILFPYLEKHGVSGPPKVMWAIQDEIRAQLKQVSQALSLPQVKLLDLTELIQKTALPVLQAIEDLIYKEENIMFPMSMETLTEGEWAAVAEQSGEIGFALIQPDFGWIPSVPPEPPVDPKAFPANYGQRNDGPQSLLPFPTGALTLEQISLIFNHLPIDITFVDKKDNVRYFSYGKERIFQRSKAIIGRKVSDCHPPDSVHIVNKIVGDFKSGKRDSAEFWIHMDGKFVLIQYFALHDPDGTYRGTIEVTQDIQKMQNLKGDKRIYSEE
ncbi:DUF438 domain-containing protein [Desulfosporosinus nitroreducens]|uniref:DUF438 domain-containing protein n=1 Tax=Desulfosporosinus nitroreducens TaxID=2018668 RepID=A0ABT8QPK2_9FIRM|nr:DUF438 domain-containing protein [Desulfosporosinus nitroreducens]MCO1602146.1 DUF438 domain-containing protein [Desulfosporosinus nitroreducens]MDO0823273.1 DUF438 domain-containing protein [Desulfosporosinus nitroreducens]